MWTDKVKLLWLWFVIAISKEESKTNIYRPNDIVRSADWFFLSLYPKLHFFIFYPELGLKDINCFVCFYYRDDSKFQ